MEIQIKNLNFSYRNFNEEESFFPPVIKNLNLEVKEGQHILIQGNGDSGKTTLSELLSGSYPDFLHGKHSGEILIKNKDSILSTPSQLMNLLTSVCQNSQNQILSTTCEDEIAFPLESIGCKREEMIKLIDKNLKFWSLENKRYQSPESLSGGERKRLLLAVATTIDAPILIFDETFDELDNLWRNKLANYIFKSTKTIVVFSSRYIKQFDGLFDTFYKMENGKLIETTAENLKSIKKEFTHFCFKECKNPQRIECKDISISRGDDFKIEIPEFYLKQGEVVSLIGENGSGKTTFARSLCGIDEPESGNFSLNPRLGKIGYIFQNPDYQIFLPTVKEELEYSMEEKNNITVEKICNKFSLSKNDICTTMSFAKRKNLQAATYYLLDRPFCIIDELDSGLTYQQTRELIDLLRENCAGILLISHEEVTTNWVNRCYKIENNIMKEICL